MRKILIGFMVVLVIGATLYFRFHRRSSPREVAYAGNREVTLWSTTAQVREPVATAKYGDRLDILGRSEDQVQVQTISGLVGWISGADLLSADLWQRAKDLEAVAAKSPVQARGHTHAISNLHVEAGRESPRIRQLNKGIPLELFERKVVDVPAPPSPAVTDGKNAPIRSSDLTAAPAKKEDWWLVRAQLPDHTSAAGWILGRFVDLDVPPPLPDYASAAAMHIVAWFELNRVEDRSVGSKPQYLLVGYRGPEGQACDFTMIRVFTWGSQKQRYETAYVESNVCGKLPMNLKEPAAPGGDVLFSFEDFRNGSAQERKYRMERTAVRRVSEGGSEPGKRKHARG
jgi:hypothetical protein